MNNDTVGGICSSSSSSYLSTDASSNLTMNGVIFSDVNGSVMYPGLVTVPMSTDITSQKLNITFNRIYLNSASLPFLNTTAQLTFLSLNVTTHTPTYDLADSGTFIDCPGSVCTIVNPGSNSTFVYNVTGFTAYRSRE